MVDSGEKITEESTSVESAKFSLTDLRGVECNST
jgi:hypothetical protein